MNAYALIKDELVQNILLADADWVSVNISNNTLNSVVYDAVIQYDTDIISVNLYDNAAVLSA